MSVGLPTSDTVFMIEVLISYQLPESLAEAELRSWLGDQMRVLSGEAAEVQPPGSADDPHRNYLLRFALGTDPTRSADDRIAELVTDMRMLGLRPETVAVHRAPQGDPDASRDGSSP